MDIVTRVELECSYGAGDGRTRSGVASMPKERSGRPRLDRSCDWEKYGYDNMSAYHVNGARYYGPCFDLHSGGILAHPYSRSQLIHSPPLTHRMMQFYMGSPIFHWTDQILAHPCYSV